MPAAGAVTIVDDFDDLQCKFRNNLELKHISIALAVAMSKKSGTQTNPNMQTINQQFVPFPFHSLWML